MFNLTLYWYFKICPQRYTLTYKGKGDIRDNLELDNRRFEIQLEGQREDPERPQGIKK